MSDSELTSLPSTATASPEETEKLARANLRALVERLDGAAEGEDAAPEPIPAKDPMPTEDPAPAEEDVPAEEDTPTEAAEAEEPEAEEPPPPVYRYRVVAVLLPELDRMLSEARQTIGYEGVLDNFLLQTDFHTEVAETVQTILQSWSDEHLPLGITVERVEALVEGAQRYIAGYALEPMHKIIQAQAALQQALASHIEPLPQAEDALPFTARLLVGDRIPVGQFPKLIHFMQQHFDPIDWAIHSIELLHTPDDDLRWEVLAKWTK